MRLAVPALLASLAFALGSAKAADLGTLEGGGIVRQQEVSIDNRTVRVSSVVFDEKESTFQVIDNPPEARKALPAALSTAGAIAGINGGYFHPDFRPLGLVVTGGKTLHDFEKAKLLSGILAVRRGKIELVRAASFKMSPDVEQALQAGPWLIENGSPLTGLNAEKPARRTIVATDGKGRWAVIATGPVTLAGAAHLMAHEDVFPGGKVMKALNLDGGSSTALFAGQDGSILLNIPSFGAVRNYLAIAPRRR